MTPCNSESIICAQHFCLNHRIHPHCDHQLPSPTSDWQVRAEVNLSDGSTWGTGGVERGGGVCTLWCLFQAAPLLKRPMAPCVCLQFEAAAPHAVACLCFVWDEIEAHCDPSLSGCVLTRIECDCQVFLWATCCILLMAAWCKNLLGARKSMRGNLMFRVSSGIAALSPQTVE